MKTNSLFLVTLCCTTVIFWAALSLEPCVPVLLYSFLPAHSCAASNAHHWYRLHLLLMISRDSCPNIIGIRANKIVTTCIVRGRRPQPPISLQNNSVSVSMNRLESA